MKKIIKIMLVVVIVLCLIIGVIIIWINRNNSKSNEFNKINEYNELNELNEYNGTMNFDIIEASLGNNEYFQFEENGQKYIMFKIIEGIYSPSTIEIESATITKRKYKNNMLYLDINIDTNTETYSVPKGMIIDGYNTDSKTFIIKVNDNFKGLIINDKEYSLLSNKVIGTSKGYSHSDKCGYIDENGNLSVPVEYDGLFGINTKEIFDDEKNEYVDVDFSNYLIAFKNDKTGIIDKQGNIIIEIKYDKVLTYSKNAFAVTIDNNSKIGIVDTNNKLIKGYVDGKIYDGNSFRKYLVYFNNSDTQKARKGILDRDLNVILEPIYDDFINYNFTRYNNSGNMNPKYFGGENGITFSKDYIVAEKDKQTAILDEDYNFIINFTNLSLRDIKNKYEDELLEMISTMD